MELPNAEDKNKKYREKCTANGLCPHCGKPSWPYYECEDRRSYKRSIRILNVLVSEGIIGKRRLSNGHTVYWKKNNDIELKGRKQGYFKSPSDRRCLPRIKKKYIDIEVCIKDILKKAGEPLSTNIIEERLWDEIGIRKKQL